MGVKGLYQLLEKESPQSLREVTLMVYAGKFIACDASNTMYQFLVSTANAHSSRESTNELMDKEGNPTGHLLGLFNRTIHFLENKVKPLWVFDGAPPELKMEELKKRKEIKEQAKDKLETAKEQGNVEDMM